MDEFKVGDKVHHRTCRPKEVGTVEQIAGHGYAWVDWGDGEPKTLDHFIALVPAGQPVNSILLKAHDLVNGDRAQAYGDPGTNFQRWADILRPLGIVLTPYQLALVMVAGKLARQTHAPKEDNLVDAAGYLEIASRLEGK